jgi:hypothetical protein
MSDVGGRERRWDEGEVGAILRRAIELQQEEERQGPQALARRGDGASLAELEAMAKEVGLEPALVRRAIAELEARPRPVPISPWTGGPRRIVFERVLPGEAGPAAVEALLPIIQGAVSLNGQGSMVGRTFTWAWTLTNEWNSKKDFREGLTISVVPRDGATTVRIEERLTAFPMFFLPLVATGALSGGIGMGSLHSPLAAAAILLVAAGSSHLGARVLYRRLVRKHTEALQELFANITVHLQSEGGESVRIAARVESELEQPVRIAARVESELEQPMLDAAPARKGALPPAR